MKKSLNMLSIYRPSGYWYHNTSWFLNISGFVLTCFHIPQQSSDESNSSGADDLAGAGPVISMPSVASLCNADCDLNGHSGWPSSLLLVSYTV